MDSNSERGLNTVLDSTADPGIRLEGRSILASTRSKNNQIKRPSDRGLVLPPMATKLPPPSLSHVAPTSPPASGGLQGPVQLVKTKRPYTPRETERRLYSTSNHRKHSGFGHKGNGGLKLDTLPELTAEKICSASRSSGSSTSSILDTKLPGISTSGILSPAISSAPITRATSATASASSTSVTPPSSGHDAVGRSNSWHTQQPPPQPKVQAIVRRQFRDSVSISAVTPASVLSTTSITDSVPPKDPDDLVEIVERLGNTEGREETLALLRALQKALRSSTTKVDAATKRSIFSALSSHITARDTDDAETLSVLLDVLLLLRVTKTNFALASKMLFSLASSDENDQMLIGAGVIEHYLYMLGRSCPTEDREAMLYGYGALKFLSFDPNILNQLCQSGLVDLTILHLKVLCCQQEVPNTNPGEATSANSVCDVMFQMTACLRNTLNCKGGRETFASLEGHTVLTNMAERFGDNAEVMCNVARIFSVLSLEEETFSAAGYNLLNHNASVVDQILRLIRAHPNRNDLVVRLAFSLGNFAAADDQCRADIASNEIAVDFLPGLLQKYIDDAAHDADGNGNISINSNRVDLRSSAELENDADLGSSGTKADTAVKVIRLYANVSIHPEAGRTIAVNEAVIRPLIAVLKDCRSHPTTSALVPVLLPTLATLNNLSFYPIILCAEIYDNLKYFVTSCSSSYDQLVTSADNDQLVAVEAIRVMGNLSRRREIRARLSSDDFLRDVFEVVRKSEGANRDICFSAVGIVVNMMTDCKYRHFFRTLHGLPICLRMLGETKKSCDWALASLICQALWNFCIDSPSSIEAFGEEEASELEKVLITLLDLDLEEEDNCEDEVNGTAGNDFQEFSSVGFHLLSKLCSEDIQT